MKNFLKNNINKISNQQRIQSKLITFLNPHSYLLARNDTELFEKFDKIYLDGIALVKIFRLFRLADVERMSFDMTSLAPVVFSDAVEENKSIYFIGTKPKVIDKAVKTIKSSFSDLEIVGYRDGYFPNDEGRCQSIQAIKSIKPDIVICGMGTPLQEQFLVDLQDAGWGGVGYTCGGFLHQTADKIDYYPKWVETYHLRWVYRICDEPKLFKRYFIDYPKFLVIFVYDYIYHRFSFI